MLVFISAFFLLARWPVPEPRGIGARGLCAPPPTGHPASPAARPSPPLLHRSAPVGQALSGVAALSGCHRVGEVSHHGPVASARLSALLALAVSARAQSGG